MADVATPGPVAEQAEADSELRRLVRLMAYVDRFGVIFIVLMMAALSFLAQPDVFLTPKNLTNILKQIASLALLSLGHVRGHRHRRHRPLGRLDHGAGHDALAIAAEAGVPWPIVS